MRISFHEEQKLFIQKNIKRHKFPAVIQGLCSEQCFLNFSCFLPYCLLYQEWKVMTRHIEFLKIKLLVFPNKLPFLHIIIFRYWHLLFTVIYQVRQLTPLDKVMSAALHLPTELEKNKYFIKTLFILYPCLRSGPARKNLYHPEVKKDKESENMKILEIQVLDLSLLRE